MKTLYIDYQLGSNMFVSGKGDNVIVRPSKSGNWTESVKGTVTVAIRETGVECQYELSIDGQSLLVDLCQLGDLRLALNEMAKRHPNTFTKYKRVVL